MMQSFSRDLMENKGVILKGTDFARLRKALKERPRIGKMAAQKAPILLKIHGLIQDGVQIEKN
jgi:hypothetical protein